MGLVPKYSRFWTNGQVQPLYVVGDMVRGRQSGTITSLIGILDDISAFRGRLKSIIQFNTKPSRTIPNILSIHQNLFITDRVFALCVAPERWKLPRDPLTRKHIAGLATRTSWALLRQVRAQQELIRREQDACGSNCGEKLLEQHVE